MRAEEKAEEAYKQKRTAREINENSSRRKRTPFSAASITAKASPSSGVYAICKADGQHILLQRATTSKDACIGTWIKRHNPPLFPFETVPSHQRVARKDVLIRAYWTPCKSTWTDPTRAPHVYTNPNVYAILVARIHIQIDLEHSADTQSIG